LRRRKMRIAEVSWATRSVSRRSAPHALLRATPISIGKSPSAQSPEAVLEGKLELRVRGLEELRRAVYIDVRL